MTEPSARFQERLAFVLAKEGGFVNHPQDPGGATNLGISLRFARTLGRVVDIDGDGDVDADDIELITHDLAAKIYHREFWLPVRAESLPAPLDLVMFDSAVNCGVGSAIRWLQAAMGVVVDGALGPRSMVALRFWMERRDGTAMLVREVMARRIQRHAEQAARQPAMVLGWSRRLAILSTLAGQELA